MRPPAAECGGETKRFQEPSFLFWGRVWGGAPLSFAWGRMAGAAWDEDDAENWLRGAAMRRMRRKSCFAPTPWSTC
eukprot:1292901-Prymnesium_polylepis.4